MAKHNQLKILVIPNLSSLLSYVNMSIGIAENLHKRGHRIIFAVIAAFKGICQSYGFEEFVLNDGDDDDKCQLLHDFYIDNHFLDSSLTPYEMLSGSLSETKHNKAIEYDIIIKNLIKRIEPHVIINCGNYVVIPSIIECGIPWVNALGCNPLNVIDDERTPPNHSGLPANDSTEWSHFREEYNRVIQSQKNELNLWLKENEMPKLPPNQRFLNSPFLNVYNFPQEIDYTDMRSLPSKWVQFDAFVRSENEPFIIPKELREKSGKLILLTMGSVVSVNVKMMKRLIEILSQTPHRYVVSKGPYSDRYDLAENMCGDKTIPQISVLPHVDMVITHGGNCTVVESFYFGKPMIVMPLCYDQFDNAQRVHEKGFGIRMDPNKCTKEELINGIERILNDSKLTMRMKEISKRIQNEMKSDKLSYLIKELIT